MTPRSWAEARRYLLPTLAVAGGLLMNRRRIGWLALGAAGSVAWFFRDPERPLVAEPNIVYAAADGVVADVDHAARDAWIPGGDALRISTFLSLHNVHVNRSPVASQVTAVEQVPGRFVPAFLKHSDTNTKNRLAMDGSAGRVVVVQIAGMIARKIACWVQPQDSVGAGQRIGLIHFGSRTDVLVPAHSAEVLVAPGDRVRAGVTPLARYHPTEETSCGST